MTKETLKVIRDILHDQFNLDDLDLMHFVIEYEKKSGEKIPDHWLAFSTGEKRMDGMMNEF